MRESIKKLGPTGQQRYASLKRTAKIVKTNERLINRRATENRACLLSLQPSSFCSSVLGDLRDPDENVVRPVGMSVILGSNSSIDCDRTEIIEGSAERGIHQRPGLLSGNTTEKNIESVLEKLQRTNFAF